MSSPTNITRTATCLCRAVSLSVTGTDSGSSICHCSNCRSFGGSAFAYNHIFSNAIVTVTKGEEVIKGYEDGDNKSGGTLVRHFCSNCGSPLYITHTTYKEHVSVTCGSLEGELVPPTQEYLAVARLPWVPDDLVKKT